MSVLPETKTFASYQSSEVGEPFLDQMGLLWSAVQDYNHVAVLHVNSCTLATLSMLERESSWVSEVVHSCSQRPSVCFPSAGRACRLLASGSTANAQSTGWPRVLSLPRTSRLQIYCHMTWMTRTCSEVMYHSRQIGWGHGAPAPM